MPIRLRRRIKILPGVYINLSKSGISTSVGVRGASVTLGHGKTRTNAGIPGSRISYNTITKNADETRAKTNPKKAGLSMGQLLVYSILGLFFSLLVLGFFGLI